MSRFMQLSRRIGRIGGRVGALGRSFGWHRPAADTTIQPALPFETKATSSGSDRPLVGLVMAVLVFVGAAGVLVLAAYERGPFQFLQVPERPGASDAQDAVSARIRRGALTESVESHLSRTADYHRWLDTLTASWTQQTTALEAALEVQTRPGGGWSETGRAALRDVLVEVARTGTSVRPHLVAGDFGSARVDAGLLNAEGVLLLLAARSSDTGSTALTDLRERLDGTRSLYSDITRVHDELRSAQVSLVSDLSRILEPPASTERPVEASAFGPSLPVWPVVAWFLAVGGLIGTMTSSFHARNQRKNVWQPLEEMSDVLQAVESGDHTPRVEVTGRGRVAGMQESLNAMLEAIQIRVVSRVEHERTVSNLVASHERTTRHERLAAADELAAGVVADLDDRVTSAVGFAEMARRRAGSPTMDRDLGALIDQLTEVGRVMRCLTKAPARIEMPLVRLDTLAADAANVARQHVWPKLEVSLRVAEGEHLVRGDVGRLRQAVLNLVANSRAAMPGGGQLWIEVGRLQSARTSDGSLENSSAADSLVLRVRDTGRGIPQADLSRLFEPFVTTNDAAGAGLGLPQVAGIMAQHGGGVRVESQEGLGTTVSLLFPRAQPEMAQAIDDEAIGELAVAS